MTAVACYSIDCGEYRRLPIEPLSEEDQAELWRPYRVYWREAGRCARSTAHLAGCVMIGSALETLLILMLDLFPDEAERTGEAPRARGGAPC